MEGWRPAKKSKGNFPVKFPFAFVDLSRGSADLSRNFAGFFRSLDLDPLSELGGKKKEGGREERENLEGKKKRREKGKQNKSK